MSVYCWLSALSFVLPITLQERYSAIGFPRYLIFSNWIFMVNNWVSCHAVQSGSWSFRLVYEDWIGPGQTFRKALDGSSSNLSVTPVIINGWEKEGFGWLQFNPDIIKYYSENNENFFRLTHITNYIIMTCLRFFWSVISKGKQYFCIILRIY